MKKIIYLLILFCPFYIFAYSDKVIPGGETIGLDIRSDGILIVGFYKANGKFINQSLQIGDKIVSVGNKDVNDVNLLSELIEEYMEDSKVDIKYKRNGKIYDGVLELSYFNGNYRTGLYVKGNIVGIGTLTYIDPENGIYGALGHVINESKTNSKVEVKEGFAFEANVTSFTKSQNGIPGSKNANILREKYFGSILKNTDYGVFGKTKYDLQKDLIDVGLIDDVSEGKAYIYTTNLKNQISTYEIKIVDVDKDSDDKNYYFEIVDDELLSMSGGIVQGMSGSPIVQNNKIIGAVTRVLIDDVKKGYGINIVTMLEEGDKLLKN